MIITAYSPHKEALTESKRIIGDILTPKIIMLEPHQFLFLDITI